MPDLEPTIEDDHEHLAVLSDRATCVLAASGLTAQDFLDDLSATRAEVVREAYSAEFLRELGLLHAVLQLSPLA